MKFYTEYPSEKLLNYKKVKLINSARRKIFLYKFGATEEALDQYCKENYKVSLRLACIQILFSSRFMVDFTGTLVIDTGEKWDKVARLITFGNGKLLGSKILKYAIS